MINNIDKTKLDKVDGIGPQHGDDSGAKPDSKDASRPFEQSRQQDLLSKSETTQKNPKESNNLDPTILISKSALENLSDQIALSLNKMKEMEEQIRVIPELKKQLEDIKSTSRKYEGVHNKSSTNCINPVSLISDRRRLNIDDYGLNNCDIRTKIPTHVAARSQPQAFNRNIKPQKQQQQLTPQSMITKCNIPPKENQRLIRSEQTYQKTRLPMEPIHKKTYSDCSRSISNITRSANSNFHHKRSPTTHPNESTRSMSHLLISNPLQSYRQQQQTKTKSKYSNSSYCSNKHYQSGSSGYTTLTRQGTYLIQSVMMDASTMTELTMNDITTRSEMEYLLNTTSCNATIRPRSSCSLSPENSTDFYEDARVGDQDIMGQIQSSSTSPPPVTSSNQQYNSYVLKHRHRRKSNQNNDTEDDVSSCSSNNISVSMGSSSFEFEDYCPTSDKIPEEFRSLIGRLYSTGDQSLLENIGKYWFEIVTKSDSSLSQVKQYVNYFESFNKDLTSLVINLRDDLLNTAVHYAASNNRFDIMDALIDTDVCDVNNPNKAGYTPVMLLSLINIIKPADQDVARRVFMRGDVNIQSRPDNQTALMLASVHGRIEIIRLLLDCGADPSLKDRDGSTALICAVEMGHEDIVDCLLEHPGTDPWATDNDGLDAITIAMNNGHDGIISTLYSRKQVKNGSKAGSRKRAARKRQVR